MESDGTLSNELEYFLTEEYPEVLFEWQDTDNGLELDDFIETYYPHIMQVYYVWMSGVILSEDIDESK